MKLLIVGPLPPPHHGVTVSTSLVLANPRLRATFDVRHLDTSDHRTGQNIGRWEIRNVALALSAIGRAMLAVRGGPGLIYLPLSQGVPGLLRDMAIVRVAKSRGWATAAHLRGGELDVVYEAGGPIFRWWLRSSLQRLDSMGVLGESLRSAVDGLVQQDRVVVVPNGTPDPGLPQRRSEEIRILALANMRPRKGVLEALEAALLVLEREENVRFVFAGDCRDEGFRAKIDHLAEQGDGRIEIRGPVTGPAKKQMFEESKILLFSPSEPEGHPRVVLEALAAGLPVVATDRGAIAETVVDGECGLIVAEPDPAELADRILRLLEDPGLTERMSRSARGRFEELYTQEVADERLAAWLSDVAQGVE